MKGLTRQCMSFLRIDSLQKACVPNGVVAWLLFVVVFGAWHVRANSSLASTNNLTVRELTLHECISLSLQHNFDVQIEQTRVANARFVLTSGYGVYDPVFGFHTTRNALNQPEFLDPKKAGIDFPYQMTTDTVGSGFNGTLFNGLTYDLNGNIDSVRANTDFNLDPKTAIVFRPSGFRDTNQYFLSSGITLQQPLLKDFWIDAHRYQIRISRKNLQISEAVLKQTMMNTVASLETAYFELIYARQSVAYDQAALINAKRLLNLTNERIKAGASADFEVYQVNAEIQNAEAKLYVSKQSFAQRQNTLRSLLTDSINEWFDVPLIPKDSLVAAAEFPSREHSWEYALHHRPDLAMNRLQLERQDIDVAFRFNQLFPRLDLVGSYGRLGVQPGFTSASSQIIHANNPYYSYGAVLSFPLGNRTARNNYKAAQEMKKEIKLELEKFQQNILIEIDNAVSAVEPAFQRVAAATSARSYSEAAYDAELKKLGMGFTTGMNVILYEERLSSARSGELRALVDYQEALARLALAEGRTLERNGFDFSPQ